MSMTAVYGVTDCSCVSIHDVSKKSVHFFKEKKSPTPAKKLNDLKNDGSYLQFCREVAVRLVDWSCKNK